MPPNYPALRLGRGNMAQTTRKGSNSGACGRGARAKPKNDAVARPQGQGYGRTTPCSCSECDNAIDENDQSIECHMCKLWYHKRYTELSEAEYRVLERGGGEACCGNATPASETGQRGMPKHQGPMSNLTC